MAGDGNLQGKVVLITGGRRVVTVKRFVFPLLRFSGSRGRSGAELFARRLRKGWYDSSSYNP